MKYYIFQEGRLVPSLAVEVDDYSDAEEIANYRFGRKVLVMDEKLYSELRRLESKLRRVRLRGLVKNLAQYA